MAKRVAVIMLLLVMLVMTATGCGSGTSTSTTTTSSTTTPSASGTTTQTPSESKQQEQKEPITLYLYTWETGEKDFGIWQDIKKDLNINVEVRVLPDTGGTDKEVAIDIVQMSGGDLDFRLIAGANFGYRAEKGFMRPLDDLIQKYNVDLKSIVGGFYDLSKFSGKTYIIPIKANTVMYMYNKDIFDKEGVPYPKDGWTWDEFRELAYKLTKGEGDKKQYGYCANVMSGYWAYPAIWSGHEWYTKDGLSNIDDPAFVNALKEYRQMDLDGVKPSYTSMKSRNSYISVEFLSGKCAIGQCLGYVLRDMRYPDRFPFDFDVGVVFPPVVESGRSPKSTTASIQGFAINPNSKHVEETFNTIIYYLKNAGKYIATSNVPTLVNPPDEVISAFISKTPVTKEDGLKFFDPETEYYNVVVQGPAAAEYNAIINEEVDLYLTGAKDLDATIKSIKTRADEAIKKAKAATK